MGLFLSMTSVVGADEASVLDALLEYAATQGGSLTSGPVSENDPDCMWVASGVGGVSVVYPGSFLDWDAASQFVSNRLGEAAFSFHIHDGDFWMYLLFDRGEIVDRFTPIPDYWGDLPKDELESWRGNADEVASRVLGVTPHQISPYLKPWDDKLLEGGGRAFPGDEFEYGRDWQLVDFMAKLGLVYPVGHASEHTCRFRIPQKR